MSNTHIIPYEISQELNKLFLPFRFHYMYDKQFQVVELSKSIYDNNSSYVLTDTYESILFLFKKIYNISDFTVHNKSNSDKFLVFSYDFVYNNKNYSSAGTYTCYISCVNNAILSMIDAIKKSGVVLETQCDKEVIDKVIEVHRNPKFKEDEYNKRTSLTNKRMRRVLRRQRTKDFIMDGNMFNVVFIITFIFSILAFLLGCFLAVKFNAYLTQL